MKSSSYRNVAVLGSTGSIGVNALDVCARLSDVRVKAISGRSQISRLMAQARQFPDAEIIVADDNADRSGVPDDLVNRIRFGSRELDRIAADPEIEFIIAGIVGFAGLASTSVAVAKGKTVGLANKESLVVAGGILIPMARETGARLLPIDSEHSAIQQCTLAGRTEEIDRIVLTASGGPFLNRPLDELELVTPAEATNHPTWEMGQKISVDSATMMNKALEVVEAAWLFGLDSDRISVVIHPQSMIHGLVEFCDGSVVAQISPPDMRLPIELALTLPMRGPPIAERLDWGSVTRMDLIPADTTRFPALELGFEVVRRKGTTGAVLNAANEVAVQAFLEGRLRFTDIVRVVKDVLSEHRSIDYPTMNDLLTADKVAREETNKWILDC